MIDFQEVSDGNIYFAVDERPRMISIREFMIDLKKNGYDNIYHVLNKVARHSIEADLTDFLEGILGDESSSYQALRRRLPCDFKKEFSNGFREWLIHYMSNLEKSNHTQVA